MEKLMNCPLLTHRLLFSYPINMECHTLTYSPPPYCGLHLWLSFSKKTKPSDRAETSRRWKRFLIEPKLQITTKKLRLTKTRTFNLSSLISIIQSLSSKSIIHKDNSNKTENNIINNIICSVTILAHRQLNNYKQLHFM